MVTLYKLSITLRRAVIGNAAEAFETKAVISIPASTPADASARFLEAVNKDHLFFVDGVYWPMECTRVLVTRIDPVVAAASIPTGTTDVLPSESSAGDTNTVEVVKKERKKRSPNKAKPAVVPVKGIKPSGRRGRASSK